MTDEEKQREIAKSVELAKQMAQTLIGNTVNEIFMAVANIVASTAKTIEPDNPYKWVLDVARFAADTVDANNGDQPLKLITKTGKLNS